MLPERQRVVVYYSHAHAHPQLSQTYAHLKLQLDIIARDSVISGHPFTGPLPKGSCGRTSA